MAKNYNKKDNNQSKKSGAKFHNNETPCITAWNASKNRGMINLIAGPYKGTKRVRSKTGKEWENWYVKITIKNTLQTTSHSAMYDVQSRKLYLKELNMIVNPKAPNGGYFGKHISKSYN